MRDLRCGLRATFVVWSAISQKWTDLIFTVGGFPEACRLRRKVEFPQKVKQRFLDETGCDGESPYLFQLTAG